MHQFHRHARTQSILRELRLDEGSLHIMVCKLGGRLFSQGKPCFGVSPIWASIMIFSPVNLYSSAKLSRMSSLGLHSYAERSKKALRPISTIVLVRQSKREYIR